MNTEQHPPTSFGARYTGKIMLIIVMSILLMIGAGAIWLMAYDRERTSEEISNSISEEWGNSASISSPVIKIGKSVILPAVHTVDITADIKSETLHRNIYETKVYTADITMSGELDPEALKADSLTGATTFTIELYPLSSTVETGSLNIGGKQLPLKQSTNGLSATLPADLLNGSEATYTTKLKVRMSTDLNFKLFTDINTVSITGDSDSPSFVGSSSPAERAISDSGFKATWRNVACAKPDSDGVLVEDSVSGASYVYYEETDTEENGCGVKFVPGIDSYRKVVRAIKYAYLIILLTFMAVFATEVLSRRNIPLLNYFLIGAALVVFYSLLLSIAELLNFDYAYLISATMTIGLICIYLRTMLHSRRLAIYNGVFLTALYAVCYVMLCVSTYALLTGSLLIFLSLAGAMNISLRISKTNG